MLTKNVIPFLTELSKNNNKNWFDKNKFFYKQALADYTTFINQLIERMTINDSMLAGLHAKDVMYRIYRDVRFTTDKTPYKTHFGANIAPGGRKSRLASFYVHIDPVGTSICGGGLYLPEPQLLKALRTEFYTVPEDLTEILETTNFKKFYNGLWGDKLILPPKGFDKNFEHIDLLKYKHYVVINNIDKKTISSDSLTDYLTNAHKAVLPFFKLLNAIAEDAGVV